MKHKIRFEKNAKNNVLTIMESSEVDPGVVQPLLEEDYDLDKIVKASGEGFQPFMQLLRRRSFFPTSDLCSKLHENTKAFFKDKAEEKIIIEYNDVEAFPKQEKFQLEDEDVELDKILEEDGDSKEDELKEIDSDTDDPKFTPEDTSEHEN
jgi:hypothetical protein